MEVVWSQLLCLQRETQLWLLLCAAQQVSVDFLTLFAAPQVSKAFEIPTGQHSLVGYRDSELGAACLLSLFLLFHTSFTDHFIFERHTLLDKGEPNTTSFVGGIHHPTQISSKSFVLSFDVSLVKIWLGWKHGNNLKTDHVVFIYRSTNSFIFLYTNNI